MVAQIPADAEPVGGEAHEEPFRAHPFEKHDELQLEEDDWVDAGTPVSSLAVVHEVAARREVEHPFEVAVEVVGRHQLVQRGHRDRREQAHFHAHHGRPPLHVRRAGYRSLFPPSIDRTATAMAQDRLSMTTTDPKTTPDLNRARTSRIGGM